MITPDPSEIADCIGTVGMFPSGGDVRPLLQVLHGGLPSFGGGANGEAYAKLHHDHYQRLVAVLDAARTGNVLLIRLAVEHQDRFGTGPDAG